jgi:hypothetical protein
VTGLIPNSETAHNLVLGLSELRLEVSNTLLELLNLSAELVSGQSGQRILGSLDERGAGGGGLGDEARGHGAGLGGGAGTRSPLRGGHSGLLRGAVREEIVLEDVRLTGNGEGDRLDGSLHSLVEAHDLVGGNVDATLREGSHTLLGLGGGVLGQEVDQLVVIDNLVVTDVTVTLTSKEKNVGTRVVERHDDTGRVVDALVSQGGRHVLGVPDGEATLRGLGEANGEQLVTKPGAATTLNTLVGVDVSDDSAVTGVQDAELLVLGEGSELRTIGVPLYGLDEVGVALNGVELGTLLNIPNLDFVVTGGGGKNVVGGGVEVNGTALTAVTRESLSGLRHIGGQTTLGNLPELDGAILRGRGEEVIVEGGPVNIENGALVSRDDALLTQLTSLVQGEDTNTSTSTCFSERRKTNNRHQNVHYNNKLHCCYILAQLEPKPRKEKEIRAEAPRD